MSEVDEEAAAVSSELHMFQELWDYTMPFLRLLREQLCKRQETLLNPLNILNKAAALFGMLF